MEMERERERNTHTHTHTQREREERDRERDRERERQRERDRQTDRRRRESARRTEGGGENGPPAHGQCDTRGHVNANNITRTATRAAAGGEANARRREPDQTRQ
jgi:hypothetical protein